MFICDSCLKPTDKLYSSLKSEGRCEVCGKVAICNDVDIHSKELVCPFTGAACEFDIEGLYFEEVCPTLAQNLKSSEKMNSCKDYQRLHHRYRHPESVIPQMLKAFEEQVKNTDAYRAGFIRMFGCGSPDDLGWSIDKLEDVLFKAGIKHILECKTYVTFKSELHRGINVAIHRDSLRKYLEISEKIQEEIKRE